MTGFDLNLITAFVTLYETQNITVAAERLCVAQPSVNYVLAKLREQLDDALLVRNQQGMQPTRLVARLYEGFKEASHSINDVVSEARKFSPSASKRRFHLTLSDLGEITLLPRVLERLNQMMPSVELNIVPLEIDQIITWLNDGHIDMAIYSQILPGAGITHWRLMGEQYCYLTDNAHPRIDMQMNMQQSLAEPYAVITRASSHGMAEDVLKKMAVECRVQLHTPHFSVLPKIILRTEMIAILPYRIAWNFCEFPGDKSLKVVDLSFEVLSFEVTLY